MWFDNGFYVELKDKTGKPATEVIVDPANGAVSIEPGPAMMWNTRFSMMGTAGGAVVDPARARDIATAWLATNQPGASIASMEAVFSLSEVRLGLIPSVISPYVIAAIGEREARRYFLTAERFDAMEARRIGLVHEVVNVDALDAAVATMTAHLLKGGPQALAAAKKLIVDVSRRPMDDALSAETARRIAAIRVEAEGQEGLAAFFDKRPPAWSRKS